MNKEEQAFYFLLDDYMQIPKTWEDYQIIKNAIAENKQLKDNWNKLKQWLEEEIQDSLNTWGEVYPRDTYKNVLEQMQEIVWGVVRIGIVLFML